MINVGDGVGDNGTVVGIVTGYFYASELKRTSGEDAFSYYNAFLESRYENWMDQNYAYVEYDEPVRSVTLEEFIAQGNPEEEYENQPFLKIMSVAIPELEKRKTHQEAVK